MSKPYKRLPEALRAIFSEKGEKMLEDIKLVNILADLCSFDEIPAANTILKKMLQEGYGTEILTISSSPSWEIKMKMLSSKIATKNGYRNDIIQYIVDSIAYGLGKTGNIPKLINASSSTSCSRVDLEIELKKLKSEYLIFLEENVIVADYSPPSFQTNDKSEIYEYREKIHILSDVLGNKEDGWCEKKMEETLNKYTPKPKEIKQKSFLQRLFGR